MGVWEPALWHLMVSFFEFLTPSILGGHNFLNSILFLTFFSVPYVPIGRVQIFLDTKNNKTLPLDLVFPKHLNVQSQVGLPYVVTT